MGCCQMSSVHYYTYYCLPYLYSSIGMSSPNDIILHVFLFLLDIFSFPCSSQNDMLVTGMLLAFFNGVIPPLFVHYILMNIPLCLLVYTSYVDSISHFLACLLTQWKPLHLFVIHFLNSQAQSSNIKPPTHKITSTNSHSTKMSKWKILLH